MLLDLPTVDPRPHARIRDRLCPQPGSAAHRADRCRSARRRGRTAARAARVSRARVLVSRRHPPGWTVRSPNDLRGRRNPPRSFAGVRIELEATSPRPIPRSRRRRTIEPGSSPRRLRAPRPTSKEVSFSAHMHPYPRRPHRRRLRPQRPCHGETGPGSAKWETASDVEACLGVAPRPRTRPRGPPWRRRAPPQPAAPPTKTSKTATPATRSYGRTRPRPRSMAPPLATAPRRARSGSSLRRAASPQGVGHARHVVKSSQGDFRPASQRLLSEAGGG